MRSHHHPRGRLQRRIFVWLGIAMVVTALAVMGITTLVGKLVGAPGWREEMTGAEQFVRLRFEHVWDVPAERLALAREMSETLGTRVELFDAQEHPLESAGTPGGRSWMYQPVHRGEQVIGFVRVSGSGKHHGGPWRALLPIGIAAVVLWGFAGGVSRRLAYPYFQLAQVARDIGDGKLKTRAPIHRQFGEARVLAQALNEMADRIERQLAEQRELLAAVSHELRTPLSRVRLLVELARTQEEKSEKMLDELDQEAVEMDRLVGELLASARIEFDALAPASLDPAELAARALERAGLPSTLLVTEGPPPRIEADATLLLRALANLLDNAKKHGGGAVALAVSESASGVTFRVDDDGPGFIPGEEAKAFLPFRRSQGGSPREGSSLGLGLSLVSRIALAHGGTVLAENRKTKGAAVSLTLPLRDAQRA